MNILQLDSLTQSLAFAVPDEGFPEVIYWGAKLSDKLPSVATSLTRKPLPQSKLKEYTPVSIIPEYGRGFFGHPGVEGHRGRSAWATQFQLRSAVRTEDLLVLFGEDPVAQLELKVSIFCSVHFGLLRIRSSIKNVGKSPYELEWLTAGCLPLPNTCVEVLTLAGRWNREFQEERFVLPIGQYRFENRYGRTSHEYFPGLIMGDHGFGQEQGSVFGFHLGWSGNWRWIVDRTPHGDLLVQAGLQPLIDRVEAAGMEFGIWIEPEMTNENSDLFRSHPDWILHLPPYHQPVGRYQYVLNLAHTEVSDYLFNALCKLLAQY